MEGRLHIEWFSLTWTACHMGDNLNPSQSIYKTSLLQEAAARRAILCIEMVEPVLSRSHAEGSGDLASEDGFAPFPIPLSALHTVTGTAAKAKVAASLCLKNKECLHMLTG